MNGSGSTCRKGLEREVEMLPFTLEQRASHTAASEGPNRIRGEAHSCFWLLGLSRRMVPRQTAERQERRNEVRIRHSRSAGQPAPVPRALTG